jgi:mono/diheme cytochrome c family protein
MTRPKDAPQPPTGRRRRAIALVLLGAGGAGAAGLVAVLLYIAVGGYDVAASIPHQGLVYWATKTMMTRSVKLRARNIQAPAGFSRAQVLAGFRTFDAHCVSCHGAPGTGGREASADGMTPIPPYLVDAPRQWSPGELYWIIRNGVKMTGMPAWDRTCTDREIWELVAFLQAFPEMNAAAYRDLRASSPPPAPGAAPSCSGPGPRAEPPSGAP